MEFYINPCIFPNNSVFLLHATTCLLSPALSCLAANSPGPPSPSALSYILLSLVSYQYISTSYKYPYYYLGVKPRHTNVSAHYCLGVGALRPRPLPGSRLTSSPGLSITYSWFERLSTLKETGRRVQRKEVLVRGFYILQSYTVHTPYPLSLPVSYPTNSA